ncbi:hypothetical protein ACF3DV_25825 [Chlorogloeopsis fritschii PCC 9212]
MELPNSHQAEPLQPSLPELNLAVDLIASGRISEKPSYSDSRYRICIGVL